MADPRVLGIVLAGGAGTRLAPLTDDRAKPAVPFGGVYRLVDFALSNLANSGIRKICVLTQYKSHSLDRHISTTWRMSDLLGNYVTPVPAQQRLGPHWYTGSADAIHQSMNLINDENPELVVVVRRRPRVPDGPAADDLAAPGVRRGRDRGGDPGGAAGREGVRHPGGGQGRADDRAVPGEAGQPAADAGLPRRVLRVDGHLRLRAQRAGGRAGRGTRPTRRAGTTSAGTSCR